MCGRLVLTSSIKDRIRALFNEVVFPPEEIGGRYNVAPGQRVPVLTTSAPRALALMPWGFAAARRAGDHGAARLLINARGETVHTLPSFREAFVQRRCILLADGFYEWKRTGQARPQPYFFARRDRGALAIAGLWSESGPDQPPGCVVITTEANQLMHPIHDRMPVVLHPDGAALWLDADVSTDTLRNLLQPCPSDEMTCHPVSDRVNKTAHEGPNLIEPVSIIEQTELF